MPYCYAVRHLTRDGLAPKCVCRMRAAHWVDPGLVVDGAGGGGGRRCGGAARAGAETHPLLAKADVHPMVLPRARPGVLCRGWHAGEHHDVGSMDTTAAVWVMRTLCMVTCNSHVHEPAAMSPPGKYSLGTHTLIPTLHRRPQASLTWRAVVAAWEGPSRRLGQRCNQPVTPCSHSSHCAGSRPFNRHYTL